MQTSLTMQAFLSAAKIYGYQIKGGVIHDFLKECKVSYYGGKCPVYYVEWYPKDFAQRIVVGGKYASCKDNKPILRCNEPLDFD